MILHIAPDSKFTEIGLRLFKSVDDSVHHCYILNNDPSDTYSNDLDVKFVTKKYLKSRKFVSDSDKYTAIVFHSLPDFKIRLPANKKILWIGWGFDYYDLLYNNPTELWKKETRKERRRISNSILRSIQYWLYRLPVFYHIYYKWKIKKKKKLISEVNYFAPVLANEFLLVKSSIEGSGLKFLDWNYGTLEDDFVKNKADIYCSGKNILFGNSATPNNNHIDFIRSFEFSDSSKKFIVPLSYGSAVYKNIVVKIGKEKFGDQFVPITNFMDIEKYNELLLSCSFVIMNHLRQAGVGNIISMMYFGAHIFVDENNPVYEFFMKEGAYISTIQELKVSPELLSINLTTAQVEKNRIVIIKHWSKSSIEEKTRTVINRLLKDLS